ncbi:enoyl-CoA hydratase/isomerase family protein [Albibacillus kandeliae]|uniref:enoyl-CoA hydratase/isomerase family protein n=1 Tax=Albibacillus kandeliae TaxID=2174228 RepID=UPI000D68638F|nr:enoyl-CoA hydratase/isomerase family protein [Albibacillus kandeliae]
MTETGLIGLEDAGDGICRLTLARPPVNALSAAFLGEMSRVLAGLEQDGNVRGVMLCSAFRVYSAGLDLKEAQAFDLAGENTIVRALNEDFLNLFTFSKPVVAAVNGAAIAGGLFFVLGADWRIAVPKAQFGLAEIRVGVDFPVGPMEIAREMLGPNTLRRLMQTGQPVSAATAHAEGFVDEVVEPDDLNDRALAKARELAALPPIAFAAVKKQIRSGAAARIRAELDSARHTPETGWFTDETRPAMQRMIGE